MRFSVSYRAVTDQATVLNMTHHSYFNLGTEETILSHTLRLQAEGYTPVDAQSLPTGEIASVAETDFDFRTMRPVGAHYDHNFALTNGPDPAATLAAPDGKLTMDVFTDKPGVQVYTGTHLTPPFVRHGGICLETQHFPDAPNIPAFPSPVVRPGEVYEFTTTFAFSAL